MSETVNHPAHYGGDTIYETIKVLKAWLTPEQMVGFCVGNAIKYLSRAGHKTADPLEDLRKARWYLDYVTAFLLEQRPAMNGSGGTSMETPRPAGVTEEQPQVSPSGYSCVIDGVTRHICDTEANAYDHSAYRYRTFAQRCRVIPWRDKWAVEVLPEDTKPASKEHVFNSMHEAVLYAGHRKATTDRPFRAVSCGDKWTVEEVTEANK